MILIRIRIRIMIKIRKIKIRNLLIRIWSIKEIKVLLMISILKMRRKILVWIKLNRILRKNWLIRQMVVINKRMKIFLKLSEEYNYPKRVRNKN
jgi:hypothetical protein